MKIVGYTPLLYGREYLAYAIRSVIDAIDECHIIYSPEGAHGHRTHVPCPETRDELYEIAKKAAGMKLKWHDAGLFTDEGSQRMSIHQYAPDADVILALDADEVWTPEILQHSLEWVINGYETDTGAHTYRIPMVHFWRSFYRAVIDDKSYPVRIVLPSIKQGEIEFGNFPSEKARYIAHMGYAQSPEIVGYKQLTHGHRSEWRKDIDWFQDRYMANAQADCHPVSVNYWTPQAVNPLDYLPEWMKAHPYFNCEVIK